MKKFLLLLTVLPLFWSTINAQSKQTSESGSFFDPFKTFVQESPEKYKDLLLRFCKTDNELTQDELKVIYYGYSFTPDYNPYERYDKIEEAIEDKRLTEASILCNIYLKKSPVSLYLLRLARNCAMDMGEFPLMAKYHTRYHQILDVITASGTGESIEKSYKVIRIRDEYEVLRMAHRIEELVSQKLVEGNYDLMTIKSSGNVSDVYFDVNRMIERLNEQQNNRTKEKIK